MSGDDWSGYDLSTIWTMVENETHEAGYAQVDVWHRIESTCRRHADAVTATLAKLEASWPATPGSAAERLHGVLADLVDAMNDTASAAGSNAKELTGLTEHIMDFKIKISDLVRMREQLTGDHSAHGVSAASATRELLSRSDPEAQRVMAANEPIIDQSAQRVRYPSSYQGMEKQKRIDESGSNTATTVGGTRLTWSAGLPNDGDPLTRKWTPDDSAVAIPSGQMPLLAGRIEASPGETPDVTGSPGSPSSGSGASSPTVGGYVPADAGGRVIGGYTEEVAAGRLGIPGGATAGPGGSGPATGTAARNGGGFVGGAPMIAGGGRPATTSSGVRIGRPGGVIGGDGGQRRRPPDPDDPWVVDREAVDPVIGELPQAGSGLGTDGDGPPPGVVEVRGWPQ